MTEKEKSTKAREELMQYISEKGFVYGPSPEIYGGVTGFYDFGPLGKILKNNIENTIRKTFIKNELYEVECPIVTPKAVWEASGHLGGFSDPLLKCKKCSAIWRADSIIEEQKDVDADNMTIEQLKQYLENNQIKCPSCKEILSSDVKQHNLMLKTNVGIDTEMYNRPETATTTYLPFLNYLRFFRDKLPFGVFQIGNAYRNEISPRQQLIRGREFTQAEAQLFIFGDQKQEFSKYEELKNTKLPFLSAKSQKSDEQIETITLNEAMEKGLLKNKAYAWALAMNYKLFKNMGFSDKNIRLKQHLPEKLAFYAEDAWDLEIFLQSYGWIECCGVHDRTDYDLKTHSKHSGKNLTALNEKTGQKETPHIIEIAIGPNRLLMATLDNFYYNKEHNEGKTKLKLPHKLSPIKIGVMPLMKKPPLMEKAKEIYENLSEEYYTQLDTSGSIGKRYLRQDSVGTPFCITIDFETIEEGENKNTVTIRERDSEEQTRVPIKEINQWIKERI
ncbi:MAG: glycine--tRNA ligase [Nanobdellota archaeon]